MPTRQGYFREKRQISIYCFLKCMKREHNKIPSQKVTLGYKSPYWDTITQIALNIEEGRR